MQTGTQFQCEIEKVALGGDGLTRVEGEVVFLPQTLPGEKVIAQVVSEKKNFSRARVVRFGEKSPHRVEPACPAFGRCPGCCYLHCDYRYETELKSAQLADILIQAGIEPAPGVLLPAAAPEPALGYRNKIVFHTHKVGGRTLVGYVGADNQTVTDLDGCPLAHPEINVEIARLRQDKSFLHSLHEGMEVTFRRTEANGVVFWRNRPERNTTWLREAVPFGLLSVPRGSFFQVNPGGGAMLIERFQELLAELAPRRVVDLYAGAGLFAACAAASGVGDILAVESAAAAAEAARYNLKSFGIPEPAVIAGDAAEALAGLAERDAAGTLLVVDPPRGGLSFPAVRALNESRLSRLVYISCGPTTWARDAGRLAKGGFVLRKLQMINMFPRTEHFELFSFWSRD